MSKYDNEKKREYTRKYLSDPINKERTRIVNYKSRIKRHKENPLKYKAENLINGLGWGIGGTVRMMNLIEKYLGTTCCYCGTLLTLDNLSVDHKTPFMSSKRKRKISKNIQIKRDVDYTPEQREKLNNENNMHIVCITCNRMKGNLNHEQFTSLLKFLSSDEEMKAIVCAKLKMSNFIFRKG